MAEKRFSVPAEVRAVFNTDPTIKAVRLYKGGWLPTSHKHQSLGACVTYRKREEGQIKGTLGAYDRKAQCGEPRIVGFSEAGRVFVK